MSDRRTVRVPDFIWDAATAKAAERGIPVSEVVRVCLAVWVTGSSTEEVLRMWPQLVRDPERRTTKLAHDAAHDTRSPNGLFLAPRCPGNPGSEAPQAPPDGA